MRGDIGLAEDYLLLASKRLVVLEFMMVPEL